MPSVRIVIANTPEGLVAAANGYRILKNTAREFSDCASRYDAHFAAQIDDIGVIDIGEQGWIALAVKP